MDTLAPASLDAHDLSTREINDRLRELLDGGAATVDVLHPGSRHSLAVGFLDHPGASVRFRGDVGYFCGGLSDGLDVAVDGNARCRKIDPSRGRARRRVRTPCGWHGRCLSGKSATVLWSGTSRPMSHISSTLRPASRSSRRLDCTRLR